MELPHLGKHCAFASCNQLDFLPFVCEACGLTFCLEHRSRDSHSCTAPAPNIPVEYTGEKSYSCSVPGCERREIAPLICHHCGLNFCMEHRIQELHNCVKLPPKRPEVSKTSQHIQNILDQRPAAPKKRLTNPKQVQMAAKVKLMKMKGVAVGDAGIPQSERVFFNVALPKLSGKPAAAMFFSKCWSVGRVIDKIADKMNISNTNNAGSLQKLRLFHGETGEVLPVSSSLEEVMSEAGSLVFNGSGLVLECVEDGTEVLCNVVEYKK